MDPLFLAVVDVGSNAIRFVAAEVTSEHEFRVVEADRAPVRLAADVVGGKRLSEESLAAAAAALRRFRARMDALGVVHYRAVATSATRDSDNGAELVERAWREAGLRLEVISGEEEARLVWRALRARLGERGGAWAMVDLGGGSVEVSLAAEGEVRWSLSEPLGSVRLLQEVGTGEGAAERVRAALESFTASLAEQSRGARPEGLVATGGNVETLADLAEIAADARTRVLPLAELRAQIERLEALSVEQRIEQLGLAPDRADVVLPAAAAYARIAEALEVEELLVADTGLKEGVLLARADQLREQRSALDPDRVAFVSDVHGNVLALRAALELAHERGAGRVVVAGDLVGDGPHPAEVVRMVRTATTAAVRGNVDRKVMRYAEKKKKKLRKRIEAKNPSRANRAWSALELRYAEEELEWLRELPLEQRLQVGDTEVLVVHGSPRGDDDRILSSLTPEALAGKLEPVDGPRPDALVCGHTHAGFVAEIDGVLVANCGSTGRPADGDPRGSLVLMHAAKDGPEAELLRFEYPVEALIADLAERGVPGIRGETYRLGVKP